MIDPNKYVLLNSIEGVFGGKPLGIKIMVAADLPDLSQFREKYAKAIMDAGYNTIDTLQAEILAYGYHKDPKSAERAAAEKEELLAVFPDPIFVEEVPNGYCSRYCCRHLPWFVVTTSLGRIKIGWRKSVINIDWSESISKIDGTKDFVKQDVTKGEKYIHAWSVKDAEKYIEIILGLQAPERAEEEGAL